VLLQISAFPIICYLISLSELWDIFKIGIFLWLSQLIFCSSFPSFFCKTDTGLFKRR